MRFLCVHTNSTAWGRARRIRNVDWLILFCTYNQDRKNKKIKEEEKATMMPKMMKVLGSYYVTFYSNKLDSVSLLHNRVQPFLD